MKSILLVFSVLILLQYDGYGQNEFDLEASQSMLMTGKGPGQDGDINPYFGQDCYALVDNIGTLPFSVRIQQKGKIIETVTVNVNEGEKIKLLKGYELYIDSNEEGQTSAKITYMKME